MSDYTYRELYEAMRDVLDDRERSMVMDQLRQQRIDKERVREVEDETWERVKGRLESAYPDHSEIPAGSDEWWIASAKTVMRIITDPTRWYSRYNEADSL